MTHVHNYQGKYVRETKIPQQQVHIAAAFGGISENGTVLIMVVELQPSEVRWEFVVGSKNNHHREQVSDQTDWTCICSTGKCDADGRRFVSRLQHLLTMSPARIGHLNSFLIAHKICQVGGPMLRIWLSSSVTSFFFRTSSQTRSYICTVRANIV